MANQIYQSYLQNLTEVYFGIETHWSSSEITIYACGVSDGYTYNPAHDEVEDLGINVVLPPVPLEDVEFIGGLMKASDSETVTDDQIGETAHAVVIFAASDDGSQLIAYIDEAQVGQLPITFVNGKLFLRWNENGILRI